MPIILNGKEVSEKIQSDIAREVLQMKLEGKKAPHLAAILVGEDPASQAYVGSKIKACEQAGLQSTFIKLGGTVTEAVLLKEIEKLNRDPGIDGYIVQLPLPKHISEHKVILAVSPEKDVDGFHPINIGKLVLGLPTYISATPYGIIQLLEHYEIETAGRHCVILGRSNIVGTPMSLLMSRNTPFGNCTVTMCHSKTKDLVDHTRRADIIIAAIGKPEFLRADMVRKGVVVIDVGINRIADPSKKSGYRLAGDVNFEEVAPLCSYITPVPGGVGKMTIASLLMNTLKAAKKGHLS